VGKEHPRLKLDKRASFVKTRLKQLPQEDNTWEADFRALPKPRMQSQTHYIGMVVTKRGCGLLAESQIVGSPSVNDLAALLAFKRDFILEGFRFLHVFKLAIER